ncbi:MAG TPA: phosphatase PAP2 family protein [Hanamia sp.]|nr:phosphatase PAP2 family protein [Hanamia sp.]
MKKGMFLIPAIFYFQLLFAQQNVDSTKTDTAAGLRQNLKDTSASLGNNAADSLAMIKTDTVSDLQQNHSLSNLKAKFGDVSLSSPYHTSFVKDGLVIVASVGVTLLGYDLIKNKKDLTPEELAAKTKTNLPFFDRWVAGKYSYRANKDSYILFDGCYAIPVLGALLNKKERSKFGQVMVMYLETVAITGSLYTLTAGLVYRSRPFVYGDKAPLNKRLDKGGQRSFYGGHVATVAATTFFTAKVFRDFNPNSRLTPWLYTGAGALTALMGYERMISGYHFFSDCVVSAVIGTATGLLIPQFHKNKNLKNISLTPFYQEGTKGFSMVYRF